jgi:hypothetical protein
MMAAHRALVPRPESLKVRSPNTAIEESEELGSIRAYNAAKAFGDQAVPLEEMVAEVESDK